MSLATATPAPALLSPTDHALVLIDFQSQMAFATKSIAPELLRRYIRQVKTGLPGMAYIRLDPTVEWPGFLSNVVK